MSGEQRAQRRESIIIFAPKEAVHCHQGDVRDGIRRRRAGYENPFIFHPARIMKS